MSHINFRNKKLDSLHLHFTAFPVKPIKGLRIVRTGADNEIWGMQEGPLGTGTNTVYTTVARLGQNSFFTPVHFNNSTYSSILDALKRFGIITDADCQELLKTNNRVEICNELMYNCKATIEHAAKTGAKLTASQLKKLNKQIADAEAELASLKEQQQL